MALQPLAKNDDAGLDIIEPLCAVFRRNLRQEGLKYTPERAQILDAIIRKESLFEAEGLQRELKGGGFRVSKATVYRTIKLLQDAGIIQRVLLDPEQSHFQLVYGRQPHDLLVRTDTHEAVQIDVPELIALRDRLCAQRGLVPIGHRLTIYASRAT